MSAFYPTGNALQRAIAVLRTAGPRSFAWRLLSECGYRRMFLLARDLADAPMARQGDDLDVGELPPADIERYLAFRPASDRERIMQRFRAGHRCFAARRNGVVLSACWAATRGAWVDFLGSELPLSPGEVYFYDAFTADVARGMQLAPRVCAAQLAAYRAAGFTRALRATVPENEPALRAHAKSGFRPIAIVGRVRIGPWRHHFRRPLAPT